MKLSIRSVIIMGVVGVAVMAIVIFSKSFFNYANSQAYSKWGYDEFVQLQKEKNNETIAIIGNSTISMNEFKVYCIFTSIDIAYFQNKNVEECIDSKEVYRQAFEELVVDKFYYDWTVGQGKNTVPDDFTKKMTAILNTESDSNSPNISAKAQIRLKIRKDFSFWEKAQYSKEIFNMYYYPYDVSDAKRVNEKMTESLNTEMEKVDVTILKSAPQYLKEQENLKGLYEYGFKIIY